MYKTLQAVTNTVSAQFQRLQTHCVVSCHTHRWSHANTPSTPTVLVTVTRYTRAANFTVDAESTETKNMLQQILEKRASVRTVTNPRSR